jgi:hypothetical protein
MPSQPLHQQPVARAISAVIALLAVALAAAHPSQHSKNRHRGIYTNITDKREESELRFELALVGS